MGALVWTRAGGGIVRGAFPRAINATYFAVEALATMSWAGWLRRHLMLYRIFNPRFMLAAVLLLILDVFAILVTLTGVRSNTISVSEVFGWAE